MEIAVGMPNLVQGVQGRELIEWATQAEELGFSSLSAHSRVVHAGHEELIALAAAAGATKRIRLVTTVMVSPLRESVLLAKQTATLDAISGGRLTLGLGVGWRKDDFAATGADFTRRGALLERQIEVLRRVWAGEPSGVDAGPVGPRPVTPGGPEVLLGGATPAAFERAGRLADGFVALAIAPSRVGPSFELVLAARRAAGRDGRPRLLAALYYVLGDAAERGQAELREFYAPGGPRFADVVAGSARTTPDSIAEVIAELSDAGVDELFLWPAVADLEQLERLAEVALA